MGVVVRNDISGFQGIASFNEGGYLLRRCSRVAVKQKNGRGEDREEMDAPSRERHMLARRPRSLSSIVPHSRSPRRPTLFGHFFAHASCIWIGSLGRCTTLRSA